MLLFFILILSLEIHFAMINNKNKLIMTSIIAMTFLIGFTANEAYGGGGVCRDDCSIDVVVSIDIKPGSDPNSIKVDKRGVIPVAILGSASFDVGDVDVTTLVFAGASPAHDLTDPDTLTEHTEDVNGDGIDDLVSHYRTNETSIECSNTSATLTGQLNDGTSFSGTDSVRTVPCK